MEGRETRRIVGNQRTFKKLYGEDFSPCKWSSPKRRFANCGNNFSSFNILIQIKSRPSNGDIIHTMNCQNHLSLCTKSSSSWFLWLFLLVGHVHPWNFRNHSMKTIDILQSASTLLRYWKY